MIRRLINMKNNLRKLAIVSSIIGSLGLTAGCTQNIKNEQPKDAYTQCVEKYQTRADRKDKYLWNGTVTIEWDEGVTFQESVKFLKDHGYESKGFCHVRDHYPTIPDSSTIDVEWGSEISTACYFDTLKDDTIVHGGYPRILDR